MFSWHSRACSAGMDWTCCLDRSLALKQTPLAPTEWKPLTLVENRRTSPASKHSTRIRRLTTVSWRADDAVFARRHKSFCWGAPTDALSATGSRPNWQQLSSAVTSARGAKRSRPRVLSGRLARRRATRGDSSKRSDAAAMRRRCGRSASRRCGRRFASMSSWALIGRSRAQRGRRRGSRVPQGLEQQRARPSPIRAHVRAAIVRFGRGRKRSLRRSAARDAAC